MVCENTAISIIDYVECFRYKLTRVCEIEQDNLKQIQARMKQWYDKDAMLREFRSGVKVIVLLLIRCHPLQAIYCWPYVIESRLNDLNYILSGLELKDILIQQELIFIAKDRTNITEKTRALILKEFKNGH